MMDDHFLRETWKVTFYSRNQKDNECMEESGASALRQLAQSRLVRDRQENGAITYSEIALFVDSS